MTRRDKAEVALSLRCVDDSWTTRSADEQGLIKTFRTMHVGELKNFVLRHMEALRDKLAALLPRSRLALVENRNTE